MAEGANPLSPNPTKRRQTHQGRMQEPLRHVVAVHRGSRAARLRDPHLTSARRPNAHIRGSFRDAHTHTSANRSNRHLRRVAASGLHQRSCATTQREREREHARQAQEPAWSQVRHLHCGRAARNKTSKHVRLTHETIPPELGCHHLACRATHHGRDASIQAYEKPQAQSTCWGKEGSKAKQEGMT